MKAQYLSVYVRGTPGLQSLRRAAPVCTSNDASRELSAAGAFARQKATRNGTNQVKF